MKSILINLMGTIFIISIVSTGYADKNIVQDVAGNCKVELETFCKDITPGKGRIFACLQAYSDRLSSQCRDAVSDATGQIKVLAAAISFVKSECGEDLQQFCKDVPAGEGRIMNCLEKNDDNLNQRCRKALKEAGLKE